MTALYHGGAPGLRVGDILDPHHDRPIHDGCETCRANAEAAKAGHGYDGTDGPTHIKTHVYATPAKWYAKLHASLYGYGDLYRVEPIGILQVSTEDDVETIMAPTMRIVAVADRAVRLSNRERRQIMRLTPTTAPGRPR